MFILIVFLQSLIINGLSFSFEKGMVLEWWPKLVKKYIKNEFWHKPLFSCIKCMSSIFGYITFWPVVIYFYDLQWVQIPVFIADVFILVWLNFFIYKK